MTGAPILTASILGERQRRQEGHAKAAAQWAEFAPTYAGLRGDEPSRDAPAKTNAASTMEAR